METDKIFIMATYLYNINGRKLSAKYRTKSRWYCSQASIDRLKAIGERMRLNGEAIEGAGSSLFINQFE